MKQISCKAMGGPCDAMISGNSMDEVINNGMKHLAEAHPQMSDDVKKMSKEETDKWSMDFKKTWDAAPEM